MNLHLGIEIQAYSVELQGFNDVTAFRFRPALGFRYYLNNTLGLYAEAGRGALSYLTLGVTLKM